MNFDIIQIKGIIEQGNNLKNVEDDANVSKQGIQTRVA